MGTEKEISTHNFHSYLTYVSCYDYLFQPLQNLCSSFPSLKILPKVNPGKSVGLVTEAWYIHN